MRRSRPRLCMGTFDLVRKGVEPAKLKVLLFFFSFLAGYSQELMPRIQRSNTPILRLQMRARAP
jgi:hypothetical protein